MFPNFLNFPDCLSNLVSFHYLHFTNIFLNQSFTYSPADVLVSCLKKKQYENLHQNLHENIFDSFGVTVTPSSGSTLI